MRGTPRAVHLAGRMYRRRAGSCETPFMLEPKARQALTQLREDTPGVHALGRLVLELAHEVDRLRWEVDELRE